jgi:uncharacterized protein YigE (DUF2233 family)
MSVILGPQRRSVLLIRGLTALAIAAATCAGVQWSVRPVPVVADPRADQIRSQPPVAPGEIRVSVRVPAPAPLVPPPAAPVKRASRASTPATKPATKPASTPVSTPGSKPRAASSPAAPKRMPATAAVPRQPSRSTGAPAAASAVAHRETVAAGVRVHVVQVDPSRQEVTLAVATSANGIGFRDSWSGMIDRVRPAAAITGTYFCTRTAVPIGSIIVGGEQVHRGLIGTAFTYSPAGGAQVITTRPGREYDWRGYDLVLRAGPRLLTGGQQTLWPAAEGFKDPNVFARKKRTALGVTAHGKVLMVATSQPVLLRELAAAMRALGAREAMAMDGGNSTGLYYRGKSHVVPGRSLTNMLVVYDSAQRYTERAAVLNPPGAFLAVGPNGRGPG